MAAVWLLLIVFLDVSWCAFAAGTAPCVCSCCTGVDECDVTYVGTVSASADCLTCTQALCSVYYPIACPNSTELNGNYFPVTIQAACNRTEVCTNTCGASGPPPPPACNGTNCFPPDDGSSDSSDKWVMIVSITLLSAGGIFIGSVLTTCACRRHRRLTARSGCGGHCPECCYSRPTETHVPMDSGLTRTHTPPTPPPPELALTSSVQGLNRALDVLPASKPSQNDASPPYIVG